MRAQAGGVEKLVREVDAIKLDSVASAPQALTCFKSPGGSFFNNWLPAYITKDNFASQRKRLTEPALMMLKLGSDALPGGRFQDYFDPRLALEVLLTLMNNTVVQLFNGQLYGTKRKLSTRARLPIATCQL